MAAEAPIAITSISQINSDIDPATVRSGKSRDIIDLGNHLFIFATDRISVFDVILPNGIPGKGRTLTEMSNFWFEFFDVPDQRPTSPVLLPQQLLDARLNESAVVVKKFPEPVIESVARGFITGSAWAEYKEKGTVIGHSLPPGMVESQQFSEPIFTPATKAKTGHDENIDMVKMIKIIGESYPQHNALHVAEEMRTKTLDLYKRGNEYAMSRGIIIADTKFEFSVDEYENVVLVDEALTPDSSRFWPLDLYVPGKSQPSFDKQFVRDWALSTGWDRAYPGPEIPQDVVDATSEKYGEARRLLLGI